MKILVEFQVISDPPMSEEDMRREFVYDLNRGFVIFPRRVIGIIPTDRVFPVMEITGFNVLAAEGE